MAEIVSLFRPRHDFPTHWPQNAVSDVIAFLTMNVPRSVTVAPYSYIFKTQLQGSVVSLVLTPEGNVFYGDTDQLPQLRGFANLNMRGLQEIGKGFHLPVTIVGKLTLHEDKIAFMAYYAVIKDQILLDHKTLRGLLAPIFQISGNTIEMPLQFQRHGSTISCMAFDGEGLGASVIAFPVTHDIESQLWTTPVYMRTLAFHYVGELDKLVH